MLGLSRPFFHFFFAPAPAAFIFIINFLLKSLPDEQVFHFPKIFVHFVSRKVIGGVSGNGVDVTIPEKFVVRIAGVSHPVGILGLTSHLTMHQRLVLGLCCHYATSILPLPSGILASLTLTIRVWNCGGSSKIPPSSSLRTFCWVKVT